MKNAPRLPANLRYFRALNKFTLQTVADALGVHRTLISHYESGVKTPNVVRLMQLVKLYNVSADVLLYGVHGC